MPPKKPDAPSKKAVEKQKQKVVEDKTFGIKNKKGAKQQKFIKQVQVQVGNRPKTAGPDDKLTKKDAKKKEQEEIALIFRPVIDQKIIKGVDPKSVLCAFFKQGLCTKGDKCKFSHDLLIERKAEKRSIYDDMRNEKDEDEVETNENWDETMLQEAIDKKHGEGNQEKNQTQIVCKYFLEAVENNKYGWFWECPNGGETCMYRHALPKGFVLKRDRKRMEEQQVDDLTLEDLIEKERAALGSKTTKVTLQSFLAWKKRKIEEKKETSRKAEEKKKNEFKQGRLHGLTGRDMFTFNPDLVHEDDDEEDGEQVDYRQREGADDDEYAGPVNEIGENSFMEYMAAGGQDPGPAPSEGSREGVNGVDDDDDDDDDSGNEELIGAVGGSDDAVEVDEDLFEDEDLDDVDEELEHLVVEEGNQS